MKKRNRSGFTLIELLAVITIMAILLVMLVPSINNLQQQNKKKGYELYAKSAIQAAKVYVEDRESHLTVGCSSISYNSLFNANLLKAYNDPRYDCSNLEVRVYKDATKTLTYAYRITCIDKEDGNKEVYSHSTLKEGTCSALS